MRVCVHPRVITNHLREMKPEQSIKQVLLLAIDTIDGQGLSNEACRELLPRRAR